MSNLKGICEVEDYAEQKKEKEYVREGNKLYLILGIVAVGLSREEFFEIAEKFAIQCKNSPDFQDKKLFVFGTVNGVTRHEIWITKYTGKVVVSLSEKPKYTWKGIFKKLFKILLHESKMS